MKKRILIGKVHDVGYRPYLLGLAESLEIERFFAENTFADDKQAVEILVDDEDDKVQLFIDIVKTRAPENAEVEHIAVEDYEGRVMKTESYYRYLTAMQLAKIATYGGKMLDKQDAMLEKMDILLIKQDEILGKQDTMLGKMDILLEKQDAMLGKQDTMLEKMDEMMGKQDVMSEKMDPMLGKQDLMIEKQDETIKVIKEESEKTREVMKSEIRHASSKIDKMNELLEKRFEKLEDEIERIKRALMKAGIEIP